MKPSDSEQLTVAIEEQLIDHDFGEDPERMPPPTLQRAPINVDDDVLGGARPGRHFIPWEIPDEWVEDLRRTVRTAGEPR